MSRLFLLAVLASGCTTSRAVRPLPAGTGALTASLGGPLNSNLGATIPIPLTSVGYVRGLDGRTNVHGAFYPTGLAAFRVFGMSGGVARQIWDQDGGFPRLMADLTVSGFVGDAVDGGEGPKGRVFTDLSGVLSWDLGDHSLYTGLDVFVQPAPTTIAHLTPMGGVVLRRGRTGVSFEAEWLAPYVDNRPLAADWNGIGHHGALQLQAGLELRLGKAP